MIDFQSNKMFVYPCDNKLTEQINAGTPLIGSAPHFYNGANQFVYGVIGLDPEKEKHETFFILEAVRINYKRSSLM